MVSKDMNVDSTGRHELVVIVKPPQCLLELRLGELWQYRDLLVTLAMRDVRVRYKQTVLGGLWALLQPVAGMIIFTIFVKSVANLPTDGIPAPVFYYAGLLPWTLFSATITGASQSLLEGSRLITKVYFPRIIIPLAVTGYTLLNLAVSALFMLILMPAYGVTPNWAIIFLPFVVIGVLLASLGVGILIAALSVKYRDFRYVVPFMVQLWFFATPVFYPTSMIPPAWRLLAALNPMVGLTEAWRACLLGTIPDIKVVTLSIIVSVSLCMFGVAYFHRQEEFFADIL